MLREAELTAHMEFASETAREAGDFLRTERQAFRIIEHQAGKDLKIRGDRETDRLIRKRLLHCTRIPVLSEESPADLDPFSQAGPLWIVDPLDGSMNYARGLELGCISIALWEDGAPLLGVIYDFYFDRIYSGIVNETATMNGHPIRVSAIKASDQAILATGFPIQSDFSHEGIIGFASSVQRYKKIRMLGTAAVSLALVASGILDAYHEREILIWDVAAGIALVEAAGGLYDIQPGKSRYSFHVFAANPALFQSELPRLHGTVGPDESP